MRNRTGNLCLAVAVWLLLVLALPAAAQKWEFGGLGGASFYTSSTVSRSTGTASAGFDPGVAAGVFLGQTVTDRIGGEIRYLFGQNDLRLESGGTKISFGGRTHTIHYDVLFYLTDSRSSARPYFAVGGGAKRFEGTGTEAAFQPLSQFAILTRTGQWSGVLDFGAGVKFPVGDNVNLRAEFRDYLSRVPTGVITPVPPSELGGWTHNLVFLFGISYVF
jgi:hypothetical protein